METQLSVIEALKSLLAWIFLKRTLSNRGVTRRMQEIMSFKKIFIYSFLAVLGLHCCTRAFSSCGEQGLLLVAVRGLLIAVASLVVEHRL